MNETQALRAWIVDTLEGVESIGRVHDRERYLKRESELARLYVVDTPGGGKCLNGWFVRRVSAAGERVGRSRSWRVRTVWLIRGYLALDDALSSELVFDGLIDGMASAFRASLRAAEAEKRLADTGEGESTGLQLEDAGPVMFAGVLCHSARLSLTTTHYETEAGQQAGGDPGLPARLKDMT